MERLRSFVGSMIGRIFQSCCNQDQEENEIVPQEVVIDSFQNHDQPGESSPSCGGCTDLQNRLAKAERVAEKQESHLNNLNERLRSVENDLIEIMEGRNGEIWNNLQQNQSSYGPINNPQLISLENTNDSQVIDNNRVFQRSRPRSNGMQVQNDRYNMNFMHQGKCIIFSHEYIDGKNQRTCAGSERNLITETFKKLNFDVVCHSDLDLKMIKNVIKEVKKQNYENDNCICIFITTHGGDGDFIWAKDKNYHIDIFKKALISIKSLAGKPKMIFVQACRGRNADVGWQLSEQGGIDMVDYYRSEDRIAKEADVLIAHSTPPDYVSWRQWFIPILCKNIDSNPSLDLQTLLRLTANEMTKLVGQNLDEGIRIGMQVPHITHTLRKKIYLKR